MIESLLKNQWKNLYWHYGSQTAFIITDLFSVCIYYYFDYYYYCLFMTMRPNILGLTGFLSPSPKSFAPCKDSLSDPGLFEDVNKNIMLHLNLQMIWTMFGQSIT